jgi:hypothetical protein
MASKPRRSRHTGRGGPRSARRPIHELLARHVAEAPSAFQAYHIPEPKLTFAGGKLWEDPKSGLLQFGPASLDHGPRTTIRVGVIGTADTIQGLRSWIERARLPIAAGLNSKKKPYDPVLFPEFPGFNADHPFYCGLDLSERLRVTLSDREIEARLSSDNFSVRVRGVVELISDRLSALAERDPAPDVVIIAMPKGVESSCGEGASDKPKRRSRTAAEIAHRQDRERGQLSLFPDPDGDDEPLDVNRFRGFRNALKAHAMKAKLTTQLIWESTLDGTGASQDPATTAWNFFTAVYYKAGNTPWELRFSTPQTCFVGITFYREGQDPDSPTRTCLAQAFSESGEGVVLRGEKVTWDKERDRKPHLNRETAESTLRQVLRLYEKQFGGTPSRVVVHKTSRYWPEELQGFEAALGDIRLYDLLALERRGIRFLRLGHEPPIRGTMIQLGRRDFLLYTTGYVPFLRVYPGLRIPNPLEVVEHYGTTAPDTLCSEILALTKLNWNSCAFAGGDPVTLDFSKKVSNVLRELPPDVTPMTQYRFYI